MAVVHELQGQWFDSWFLLFFLTLFFWLLFDSLTVGKADRKHGEMRGCDMQQRPPVECEPATLQLHGMCMNL